MTCWKCGQPLADGANFCWKCGANMKDTPTPVPETSPELSESPESREPSPAPVQESFPETAPEASPVISSEAFPSPWPASSPEPAVNPPEDPDPFRQMREDQLRRMQEKQARMEAARQAKERKKAEKAARAAQMESLRTSLPSPMEPAQQSIPQPPVEPAQQGIPQPPMEPVQQGIPQPPVESMQQQGIPQPPMEPVGPVPPVPPVKKKEKKKRRWKLWVILSTVLVLLIAAVVVFFTRTFPLQAKVSVSGNLNTTQGVLSGLQVKVESNQGIQNVLWSLDPEDPSDESLYTSAELSGGWFNKTGTLPDLQVPAGESILYVKAKTWFGETEPKSYTITHTVGKLKEPNLGAMEEQENGQMVLTDELMVIAKEGVTQSQMQELAEEYQAEIVGNIYYAREYQFRFSEYGSVYRLEEWMDDLRRDERVEAVYKNYVLDTGSFMIPDDTEYDGWDVEKPEGNNWGMECIDAPGAWEKNDEMESVKVGIIDSALQYDHSDLMIPKNHMHILATEDFPSYDALWSYMQEMDLEDPNNYSYYAHGTHVAGIIAALGNNGRGVAGVNWNTEIYFATPWYYQKQGENGITQTLTLAGLKLSISEMVLSGTRVINMSIGSVNPSEPGSGEEDDIAYIDSGIAQLEEMGYDFLLIKAAGNSNDDASRYYLNRILTGGEHTGAHTVVVGAVTSGQDFENWLGEKLFGAPRLYQFWQWNERQGSNYGDLVDVTAPGEDIYSTVPQNEYANMTGTSMATPMVTGVGSLLYSYNPDLTYDVVKVILCNSSGYYCSRDGRLYSVISASKALSNAENFNGSLEEQPPEYGFVSGAVRDASSEELITNAVLIATNTETGEKFTTVGSSGLYELPLLPGVYDMEFSAEGYKSEVVYDVKVETGVITYNILLRMVEDEDRTGAAEGYIVDAFDASRIPSAVMKIREGSNNRTGTVLMEYTCDENGAYRLELPPGNYTAEVSAEGYQTDCTNILVIPGETRYNQDCTLTPILKEGEVRIVLTWGETPSDLDSHLRGPLPGGETFHTFYSRRDAYEGDTLCVNLDVDDTTSYGPETTSVYVGASGEYTYCVHDFTNRHSSSSGAMGTSGAQVKVYMAGLEEPMLFNVPNRDGTVWTVFTLKDGVITPVNTMSYESDPDDVGR